MNPTLLSLLAFAPLVLAAVLLVGFNWPAKRAMPLVLLVTVLIALTAWDMTANRVLASSLQGLILTGAILWIIFGAILLLNTAGCRSSSWRGCLAASLKALPALAHPLLSPRPCWWRWDFLPWGR